MDILCEVLCSLDDWVGLCASLQLSCLVMLNNLVIEFSAVQDTILRNEAAEAFMHTCTENCGLAAGFPAYFNLAYHLCLLLF